MKPLRPIANVLASTNYGMMIVNRNDYRMVEGGGYGVGYQILNTSAFDQQEVYFALQLINERRKAKGDGVIVLDCGANIGTHTVEWATHMTGWGMVYAIEAQERVYYSLCGNIALNNLFNARAIYAAVGIDEGTIDIPMVNYFEPASFGSLELIESDTNEDIGQKIDYSATVPTRQMCLDSMNLMRLDFIKMDIEGMELEGLAGAVNTIRRCKPYLMVEKIKVSVEDLETFFKQEGYKTFSMGMNLLAIPADDPIAGKIKIEEKK